MSTYAIDLPIFKGPFDLLLFFIERDELDIHDIPISRITQDFLGYLRQMEAMDIEVASEFILVAATLMRIKSKMLLPRPELDEEGNEIDPREDLVRHLLEYKRYKEVLQDIKKMEAEMAAREIRGNVSKELEQLSASYTAEAELESLELYKLMRYYEKVMERFQREQDRKMHTIKKYPYTVNDQKDYLLKLTRGNTKVSFNEIIEENPSRIYFIFNFLALLELIQVNKLRTQVGEGYNNFWLWQIDPSTVEDPDPDQASTEAE